MISPPPGSELGERWAKCAGSGADAAPGVAMGVIGFGDCVMAASGTRGRAKGRPGVGFSLLLVLRICRHSLFLSFATAVAEAAVAVASGFGAMKDGILEGLKFERGESLLLCLFLWILVIFVSCKSAV